MVKSTPLVPDLQRNEANVQHVFVETNWLVGYAAPAHQKVYAAVDLLKKANRGEVRLYLPSICLSECRRPIREKFQVRSEADRVRKFLLWAKRENIVEAAVDETVRQTLDQMESLVRRDLDRLNDSLENLRSERGVEIFNLNENMLERCAGLSHLGLQPFDQAILASIIVKAEILKRDGVDRFAFCEADSDLQPWDKLGARKEPLASVYDQTAIWVYQDFLLERPEMPEGFPSVANPES
jgi:predicted nucleic acid-binding protein